MSQLTVIIPTSPIPSHPSTAILDETIANIRKYTDAEIIIMFDGVHSSLRQRKPAYIQYKDAVMNGIDCGAYGNCRGVIFEGHEHQARMTKKVLETVTTPLIMFCEHDCSPVGEIPFNDICALVDVEDSINYMRFNIFDRILSEHKHLMLSDVITDPCLKIPYVRTIQWSQRPHIAKTKWYLELLNLYIKPTDKIMIEDALHGQLIRRYKYLKKDNFGLAIYAPEGSQLRSYHSDARGTDKKIIYG
jgi:sulfur relay (sulfurtransferase) DsrF/TusC family protein